MDFNDTPNYRGHTEIGLSAWLIGFSTLFYGLRLVVRVSMTKSPGLDDGIAGIAYVSSFFLMMTNCAASTRY